MGHGEIFAEDGSAVGYADAHLRPDEAGPKMGHGRGCTEDSPPMPTLGPMKLGRRWGTVRG